MSTYKEVTCPECGHKIKMFSNPVPTVDIIIETGEGIVLILRKNPPHGWAIPGGFVDYGECLEDAACREAREETGLDVKLVCLLGVYSDPSRDPRHHTISAVFVASAKGDPKGDDDALEAKNFRLDQLPANLSFDHGKILKDYMEFKKGERGVCTLQG